ncbi:MAG: 16S rRNA (guanine(527)-N(7))-methyltransferase RsmG [Desulfopila sp.]
MTEHDFEFAAVLEQGCRHLQLDVKNGAIDRLAVYYEELVRWSRKTNLIGKQQGGRQIVENHFLDSLLLLPLLQGRQSSLVDVGTGAGFPGLVCKAAWPELALGLIEPRRKRVSFLRHIIRRLRLEDVRVMPCRVEELAPEELQCSHITSRAVAEIAEFVGMVGKSIPDDTIIICMKGPRWRSEMEQATALLEAEGYGPAEYKEYVLPFSGARRAVVSLCRGMRQ